MPSNKNMERRNYLPGNRADYFKFRDLVFGKSKENFNLANYEMFYWINFFQFNNKKIENVKDQIIYALWTSGSVCMDLVNGKFMVGVPAPKRWNIYNQIEEFNFVRIGAGVNSTSFVVDYDSLNKYKDNDSQVLYSNMKREECAVASTSFLFQPWVNGISYFQDMLDDAITNIKTNLETIRNSRIVFGSKEEIKQEMLNLSKDAGSVILLSEGTNIGEWGLGDRSESCWLNYESVIDNFEKFRGIRNIQNEKKERKISVEAVSESISFEYQERNKIRVIQQLMDEIKRIWPNEDTTFTNIVDEIIKENEIFEKGNNGEKEDGKQDNSNK